ncbi:MAG: Xaa-Pro peptidase family protein [Nitrospiraceae bacterium]|nr:Xaa-Pro peptidase family protein [Nitrospiraceae bacterium]
MTRLKAITEALRIKGVDGALISNITNVRYLSGFTGSSAYLLIGRKTRLFITDFRYQDQAAHEVSGFRIEIVNDNPQGFILEKARAEGLQVLGFESTVSYGFYRGLLRKGVRTKALTGIVEEIRRIKDRTELGLIGQAVRRAEKSFLEIHPQIRPGVTELQIALMLEERLKKNGCRRVPFDIIVAAGKNSAMPHAHPTGYRIRPGDLVVVDWGGEAGGYFSDMTRTLLMPGDRGGTNLSRKREIYATVLSANQEATAAVASGVHAGTVDRTARDVIQKAGYGEFFGHGTGHGVGLEVHELPRISRVGRETLRPGMVFTIEPGIYIPDIGGVRIEDMVVAKDEGRTVMTSLSREPSIQH